MSSMNSAVTEPSGAIEVERVEVAVTGIGLITPLGIGWNEHVAALRRGEPAITFGPLPGTTQPAVPHAACADFDISGELKNPKTAKYFSRSVQLAVKAALDAVSQSGLADLGVEPAKIGVYTGTGQTGLEYVHFSRAFAVAWGDQAVPDYAGLGGRTARLIDPYFSLRTLSNAAIAMICIEAGAQGPSVNFVHSDTASAQALNAACDDLSAGRCDIAIAGGSDSLLLPGVAHAYHEAGMLATSPDDAMRPFDPRSRGIALGEGAAFFVLERSYEARSRGANILGEISAIHSGQWLSDSSLPCAARVLAAACEEIARVCGAPDFLIAEGMGMAEHDAAELKLLAEVAGQRPVTVLKGLTGYLGAATAAVETAIGLICARNRFVPGVARRGDSDSAGVHFVGESGAALAASPAAGLFHASGWGGDHTFVLVTA
jgi:3-oxoacyl-[acyl-carrier-protein] synthase II